MILKKKRKVNNKVTLQRLTKASSVMSKSLTIFTILIWRRSTKKTFSLTTNPPKISSNNENSSTNKSYSMYSRPSSDLELKSINLLDMIESN
jgi:hypothetical protein